MELTGSPVRTVSTARIESSAGGAAGVEIAGFPQILYTRTFGDPDMLFVPLLDAAREASAMIERVSNHGEERDTAVRLSGMQLASSLLRDSSFSLVAKGLPHENVYTVDLDSGTLMVQTRLYAVVNRRTSFFKVEITGMLSGGQFVVRNPAQGSVITQVEEERLRQPNFFASALAQECLRAQMERERFGRIEESVGTQAHSEVRMIVDVAGSKVPAILRQKNADGEWDIVDGRSQELVGRLTPEDQRSLSLVIHSIQLSFNQK